MVANVLNKGISSMLLMASALTFGCSPDVGEPDAEEERNAEIIDNLLAAGFAEGDIEVRAITGFDENLELGDLREQVFVDGDTLVTLEASRELLGASGDGEEFRLWRTPNLVTNPSTICLAKVNSAQAPYGSYVLTADMATGVDRARYNYTALAGFGLTFVTGNATLSNAGTLSHSIPGCTYSIFIYKVNGPAGGTAGWPSGGAPYNLVQLNSGLAGLGLDVHEHVATHEIGHAIGLRHADWKTRVSCGENASEAQSGAVQIPGTVDQTTNSLMTSCFSLATNGEFKAQDTLALSTLY